ncbi:hypothetical protein R6Q59_027931 [Mikania micrantha]
MNMKSSTFLLWFIVLLALVIISYAGRSYPPQAYNPKGVEAGMGSYHTTYTSGDFQSGDWNYRWGGYGGWP